MSFERKQHLPLHSKEWFFGPKSDLKEQQTNFKRTLFDQMTYPEIKKQKSNRYPKLTCFFYFWLTVGKREKIVNENTLKAGILNFLLYGSLSF